ncbi:hypothetical protein MM182_20250 [Aeromonas sp. MR19]|uniref:hypothetical protein n=1 Tax=Aeromonas sp. MR19 TaxID=2923421 RepID=UPI001F4ADAC3|nr:hypothetical protein [Aeromonas sp. MR19]MCH7377671.1 hypothetical protein [Aeromonas sp. MR19]
MESWIKLLDVSIWPATVLILALIFKGEFSKILTRMSKFKYKDIEASFDQELSIVEETTKETNKVINKDSSSVRDSYNYTLERILQLADVSPRACVSEAWREVESVTVSLMHAYNYDPRNVQMSKIFRGIVHDNGYPWSLYEDYRRLMNLRNQAVHAGDFDLSKDEAERYAMTAIDLAVFIDKLAKEAPNKSIQQDISEAGTST